MTRPGSQLAAAVAGSAVLAGAIVAGLLMPAHRPPPGPAVVHVVIDRPEVAAPTDLEWLLLEPVLGPDELAPADNP